MAVIKLGLPISKIAGSVGNHVYSSWRGESYIRSKSHNRSNPNSPAQAAVRAAAAAAARAWNADLTAEEQALWNEAAQPDGVPMPPASSLEQGSRVVIPQPGNILTGFNAFVAVQIRLLEAGIRVFGDWLKKPSPDSPNPVTDLAATPVPVSEFVITWGEPLYLPEDSKVRIWVLSEDVSVHRQIVANVDIGVKTYALADVRVAQGKTVPIRNMPGHYLVQADVISPGGNQSPPSNTVEIHVMQYFTSVIDSLDNLILDSLGNYIIVPH